ncbi:MAG: CBS domain-containing protein [Deltaproteobacteria bacterium]|nr:CBS domain-containing protein [Deltaproteobacteria bacterium]
MFIKDVMQTRLITLFQESTIREAARLMKEEDVGCVLITDGQRLKGLITDRDIACWLAEGKDPDKVNVGYVMQKNIITAAPETDIYEASKLMASRKIRRLPIVEDNKLCGLVTTSDIADVLEEEIDNFFHVEAAYHH